MQPLFVEMISLLQSLLFPSILHSLSVIHSFEARFVQHSTEEKNKKKKGEIQITCIVSLFSRLEPSLLSAEMAINDSKRNRDEITGIRGKPREN